MQFSELKVGMKASSSKTITEADILMFGAVSTDFNPVHFNEEAAKATPFGKRIAHGMLSASLISAVIGTKLPGDGTIYMGQDLKFVGPVFIGDTITAEVEVEELITEKSRVILKTTCRNQDGKDVIVGKATVLKK